MCNDNATGSWLHLFGVALVSWNDECFGGS